MARLILDTSVFVAIERGQFALSDVVSADDNIAMAAVSVAELLLGAHLADTRHRKGREAFVEEILSAVPILDYDVTVARAHARLLAQVRRAGATRGALDLVIGATAAARDRTILTSDSKGFGELPGVDVRVVTP